MAIAAANRHYPSREPLVLANGPHDSTARLTIKVAQTVRPSSDADVVSWRAQLRWMQVT